MSQTTLGPDVADKLITELTALSLDAKRKTPEIRHACDHSIDILKPFSAPNAFNGSKLNKKSNLHDTLCAHPEFIVPLLMACHSKNVKLISHAISILSKIIQLKLLPSIESTPEGSPEPIDGVVDALMEASTSGSEIQVKILQLLPSFFQLYATRINGNTLSKMLFICSTLQGANKGPVIINTAQATFSQLIDIAFEKVTISDTESPMPCIYEIPIDNDQIIKVNEYVYDAQRLVSDLCTLIEHHKPSFLKTNYITEDYGFEILESLIKNNASVFMEHNELSFLLRTRVAPILLRFVSSSKEFTLMVKVSRLISLLLNEEFDVLRVESEVTLTLLTHILSKDSGAPQWKKTMVLEIYASLFKNADLLKKMFMEYDNNPKEERKSVIHDFLKVCLNLVNEQRNVLNTGDLIQLPPPQTESVQINKPKQSQQSQRKLIHPQGLRASDFIKTIRYLDSIEKQEPPQIADTYNLYLISQILILLSNCIQTSTLDLMKAADPIMYISEELFANDKDPILKASYECICDLITSTWSLQLDITNIFMHSTLDNDLFSGILKLLENLCYCSGVLSINEVKHSLLKYLSVCVLKLDGKSGYQSKVMSISETIVGTISSTLGHAVSNISNSNNNENLLSPVRMYPRTINTRQTLCFHTLLRLAVSLGSHLFEDWKLIFIVLQWVSYYIDGTSGFNKKDVPPMSPYLINRDLQIIEHSLSELNKSVFNQDDRTFTYIINSIIVLSDSVMSQQHESNFGVSPLTSNGEIQPCLFNRLFYINKMTDICGINPINFMIMPENNLNIINDYFCKIADDRSNNDETRLLASRSFNQIVKISAEAGFENELAEVRLSAETKVLSNMCTFMTRLSKLPLSNELLVANCEAEMYLQTLETLKNIIDRFGSLIQQTWNIVTEMLNFPFLIISNSDSSIMREKIITDIIVSVLKSSFETLKVILDEILQSIPKNQIKVIIDSLYKFVKQTFDINISFNSVSYFWLISDYIKDKLESISGRSDFKYELTSEKQLVDYVKNDASDDYKYYQYLWIYLVLQLAKTSPDDRVQVRNGAILTTFSVIQSFSAEASQYSILYDIVLKPVILEIKPPKSTSTLSPQDQKEWMESFVNISNGITKLLLKLINALYRFDSDEIKSMWKGIINYFVNLLNLDYNWIELNNQIFKNYHEILSTFNEVTGIEKKLPNELLDSLFEPWTSVKINYSLTNDTVYQASLCSFVDCFPLSMKLFKPIMTTAKFEKMLLVLNSSIRYPILIDSRNDNMKCTALQQSVLDNLSNLTFEEQNSSYSSYEFLLIQQLNLIVVLPFRTRDLIVKKLGNKGVRIPTFIAASYYGLEILQKHLQTITDLTYLNDGSILKVMKSLLEPSQLKSDVFYLVRISDGIDEKVYLWTIIFRILVNITVKMINLIIEVYKSENGDKTSINKEYFKKLIPLSLSVFDCSFVAAAVPLDSNDLFDLEQYHIMKNALLKVFNTCNNAGIERIDIEHFFSSIWNASFYYNHDPIIESILPSKAKILSTSTMNNLTNILIDDKKWDIYGSTTTLTVVTRLEISRQCFKDLVTFLNSSMNPHIWQICLPFFIARCAVGLRKFIMDTRLFGVRPVSRILLVEVYDIVEGIYAAINVIVNVTDKEIYANLRLLYPILVELLPNIKDKGVQSKLVDICMKLGGCKI